MRGLIDHVEILANDGVLDEPDSLFLLGGAPGGYPDHQADFWLASGDFCPPVPANANPFILGHFKTGPIGDPKDPSADFDGETDADYCFLGSGLWQAGYVDPLHPDSIPFAPNNFETFNLPQYNYLVIWEFDKATNTVLYDKPHMRAQVGIELDAQGNPIPHAFAPYPTAPGKELSDFAAYTDVLGHPNLAAGASAVTLTVRNLKPLASGQSYQIWLYDEVEGDATKVEATYTRQQPDTLGLDPLGEPIIDWVDVEGPGPASDFSSVPGYRHVVQLRNQRPGTDRNTAEPVHSRGGHHRVQRRQPGQLARAGVVPLHEPERDPHRSVRQRSLPGRRSRIRFPAQRGRPGDRLAAIRKWDRSVPERRGDRDRAKPSVTTAARVLLRRLAG